MYWFTNAGATEDAINAAREAFHLHLSATQKTQQHAQDTSEEDLSQLDERELDTDLGGTQIYQPPVLFLLFVATLFAWLDVNKSSHQCQYIKLHIRRVR